MSQSARFIRTRDAHRTELAEDYVETILDLVSAGGEAKLTEIAARFGVSHPSAFKTIKRLESEGLLTVRPYKGIALTPAGEILAKKCQARHGIVVAFLLALGLDPETAELDSEGIEHHVSEKTLAVMRGFIER
jgi:DtxR family transcriptional regulator, manganese transport regulator